MPPVSRAQAKISRLYSRGLTLIERDIEAIAKLSQYGDKLGYGTAKDLRDYMKVLADMKEAHDKLAIERREKVKQQQADKTKTASEEELLKAASTVKEPS